MVQQQEEKLQDTAAENENPQQGEEESLNNEKTDSKTPRSVRKTARKGGDNKKIKELEKQIVELTEQNQEYIQLAKRQQAEFENYRKRTLNEREDFRKSALRDLLEGLLEIDDNFRHALNNVEAVSDLTAFKDGVSLISRQFSEFMKKNGVELYESRNQDFDPSRHEAMFMVEEGVHDGNLVVEVFREGYMLYDKILRLARVKVAKGSGGVPAGK